MKMLRKVVVAEIVGVALIIAGICADYVILWCYGIAIIVGAYLFLCMYIASRRVAMIKKQTTDLNQCFDLPIECIRQIEDKACRKLNHLSNSNKHK